MCNITVFTPTYNRKYVIRNLYESLKRQTYTNFEWLVIDDGSTDDTEKYFSKWISESVFPIHYIKVCNGGKPRAINRGVLEAKGRLFFIVDSDDYLTDDALELVAAWENGIQNKAEFAGVSGNRGNQHGELWGTTFEGDTIDCTSLERIQNHITGDKAEVYYTDVLRKYPFPEISGEKYVPLVYVWHGMANDGYKIRWVNRIIYIGEYLSDGITAKYQRLLEESPKGYALYKVKQCEYEKFTPKMKKNSYWQYYCQLKNKLTLKEAAENLQCSYVYMLGLKARFWIRDLVKGKAYE